MFGKGRKMADTTALQKAVFVVEEKHKRGAGVQEREFYNWYQMPSEANNLTNTVFIKQIP